MFTVILLLTIAFFKIALPLLSYRLIFTISVYLVELSPLPAIETSSSAILTIA
jgi:hypothetical protein